MNTSRVTSELVHLVFPDVLRTLQRKWASCNTFAIPFLTFPQSSHSILSHLKGVTQTTRTCGRGSSHTFKPSLSHPSISSHSKTNLHTCTLYSLLSAQ